MFRVSEVLTYLEFARVGFVNILAYRLRYYTGVLTYSINVAVYYFIWKAIYAHSSEIEGFDLSDMITYVAMGWVVRSFYFNNIDHDLAVQVMEGKIAMDLIKPVNAQLMYVSEAMGESCFRLFMLSLPTLVVLSLVFPLKGPADWRLLPAFFASVVLAFFLVALVNFLVGTCAIRLKSVLGLLRAKHFLIEILSGLLIPISFFPGWAQRLMDFLPFQFIAYGPLLIYLGKRDAAGVARTLALQLLWVGILFLLGHLWWRSSIRKLAVHGG
ncbi:MAG: ABC-2 family transporter protein [Acidobacteria bacterium]|nr:ABC-2 family transporter protein [Acidobacteriota bacterium]